MSKIYFMKNAKNELVGSAVYRSPEQLAQFISTKPKSESLTIGSMEFPDIGKEVFRVVLYDSHKEIEIGIYPTIEDAKSTEICVEAEKDGTGFDIGCDYVIEGESIQLNDKGEYLLNYTLVIESFINDKLHDLKGV